MTLFYVPRTPLGLNDNVVRANWRHLHRIAMLSHGFQWMVDPKMRTKCVHELTERTMPILNCWCDECERKLEQGQQVLSCIQCNYDQCLDCKVKNHCVIKHQGVDTAPCIVPESLLMGSTRAPHVHAVLRSRLLRQTALDHSMPFHAFHAFVLTTFAPAEAWTAIFWPKAPPSLQSLEAQANGGAHSRRSAAGFRVSPNSSDGNSSLWCNQHGIHPLREKKQAQAPAVASDSGGSSASSGSSSSTESSSITESNSSWRGEHTPQKGRRKDPAHVRMQDVTKRPFKRYRSR